MLSVRHPASGTAFGRATFSHLVKLRFAVGEKRKKEARR
jgi:hypothetical protein